MEEMLIIVRDLQMSRLLAACLEIESFEIAALLSQYI